MPILFYHIGNRLAQRADILLRDAGDVDSAGADDVDRVLLLERFDLLGVRPEKENMPRWRVMNE